MNPQGVMFYPTDHVDDIRPPQPPESTDQIGLAPSQGLMSNMAGTLRAQSGLGVSSTFASTRCGPLERRLSVTVDQACGSHSGDDIVNVFLASAPIENNRSEPHASVDPC